jgi:hypothetical protein
MNGRGSVPLAVPTVGIVGHRWAFSNDSANLILPVFSDKRVCQALDLLGQESLHTHEAIDGAE